MSLRLGFLLLASLSIVLPAVDAPDRPIAKPDRSGDPVQRFMRRHRESVATAVEGGRDLVLVGDHPTGDFRGTAENVVAAI